MEVVLNSYKSIRVYSSQLGGDIEPPVTLSALSDDDRLDLQLAYLEANGSLDVKYAINGGAWVDLAAATGISPSGTRSRIERALKRLRKDLSDG